MTVHLTEEKETDCRQTVRPGRSTTVDGAEDGTREGPGPETQGSVRPCPVLRVAVGGSVEPQAGLLGMLGLGGGSRLRGTPVSVPGRD